MKRPIPVLLLLVATTAACETVETRRVVRGVGTKREASRRIATPSAERPSRSLNLPAHTMPNTDNSHTRREKPVASTWRPKHVPRDAPWPSAGRNRPKKLRLPDIRIPWWLFF